MIRKKFLIDELKEGAAVDDVFVVKIKRSVEAYAKGFLFSLIISDKSGKSLDYRYWGSSDYAAVKALYDTIEQDSIVRIQGKVGAYNGKLQLTTNAPMTIVPVPEGEFDVSDFVPRTKKNIDEMYKKVQTAIDSVSNPKIKQLLFHVFADMGELFKQGPAAIEIHHNWIGGLLEHTVQVLEVVLVSAEQFNLNKDLVIAGALLHDIGKLKELKITTRIRADDLAQLNGHLVIGATYVDNECQKIGMDEETRAKIVHLIVAHHGHLEYGSPKEPMFPEALAVYLADELSCKLAEMQGFIASTDTTDKFAYSKRNNRNIFLG